MIEAGLTRVFRTIPLILIVVIFCPFAYGLAIHVDDDDQADFDNIQAAIDAAESGDTVSVAPGTYYENITLKDGINLSGAGAEVTIIDANGYGDVVDARANDVTISGFTLKNSGQFDSGHMNCGVYIWGSYTPIVRNNVIVHNNNGIGIWDGANPDIRNNIIKNNSNGFYIYGSEESPSNPAIINNTIVNNENNGITLRVMVSPVIVNNIITGHITGINHNYVIGSPTLNYNNLWRNDVNYMRNNEVDDTLAGPDSISVDPYFAEPGYWDLNGTPDDPNDDIWIDGDYHLKSQAGRWDTNSQSWIQDDVTSPCIDAGDPNSPIGHEPFPNGGRINMGAYGGTPEASKSYILAKIIYVDDDAVGNNDGSSWQNAYTFLQDALTDAGAAEKPVEIRVAQGTYKPDQGGSQKPGDRVAEFQLINSVAIKGGYAGAGAADPNVRNIDEYETILSGDLNGDDIVVSDPCDLFSEDTRTDNSSHVVESINTNETAVLDGCIITGGYFRGAGRHFAAGAAGMINYSGSPTLTNCTFTGNAAVMAGSGLCNLDEGNLTLTGCTFKSNYNLIGATIYNAGSNLTLMNCVFTRNHADGGGVFNSGNMELTNCSFNENSASKGGGVYNLNNLKMTNCRLTDNSASIEGGGLYNYGNYSLVLNNCTFVGNSADKGNALACNSHLQKNPSIIEITNCILWDGNDEISNGDNSTISINYSNIQGGWPGEGNIDTDPCFVDPGYWADAVDPNVVAEPNDPNAVWVDGDYHLKSQAGRWDPVSESWVVDDVTSPCIDTSDPNSPIGHEPFPNGGIINMGAYGGTPEASKSYIDGSL